MEQAVITRPQRANGRGRLDAKFLDGRTRLATFFQEGCAKIRMPESFDGRMEAVLINSSGGLTGGDRLSWDFTAGTGTHLTLTTQACEKIYKASSDTALVTTNITVQERAVLHWLPQESIVFDQASLTRTLDVNLHETSEFLGIEAILLGRKAMGESVNAGLVRDRWRIRKSGKLIHAEELALSGPIKEISAEKAVLNSHVAFATLLYVGPKAESHLATVRGVMDAQNEHGLAGTSLWNDKLIARFMSSDGFSLRKLLVPVISALRDGASVPKVWNL
ncbi:MAG TPA: urease accessory protein [Rhizobium sp.]|nr:urease accessory protein [Rhizobium sp.]